VRGERWSVLPVFVICSPMTADSRQPVCPRCGSSRVKLCGQSVQYGPEERPGQPMEERELHTLAYQCECGVAFTQTVPGGARRGDEEG
jgi:hypothetical protein